MPRKKDIFKHGGHIPRIRENSGLMHTHESIVDVINGRHPGNSFLDALGFDFFRSFGGNFHNDIIYSDDDDDDDDDLFFLPNATHRPLQPHPRIRQLTDEEAEKHAKELIAEEEKRKEKTERNKRKKLRKKEKKRLEKENAVKVLPEEEQGMSDSDIQDETPIIESNTEANEYPKSSKTHNAAETAGCDESSGNNTNETVVQTKKKEDVEQKDLDLNNSYASAAKSVPEETCNQEPAIRRKEEKSKLLDVQQPKEVKLNIVEKPEVQKKEEEKPETNKEKPMDPTADDYAKRSRELANIGNHLAASGQYEMAVKCFTDAIKFNPKEFKLFGNRSLCYERMQQYENALRDADLALCMEPNWIKGLFRKGKALCGLKKYYEASLIYKEVLKLDSVSAEAVRELKRAQTLHLMEMGFTWAQSSEALKTHATLEQAIEALFGGDSNPGPGDASASRERHNLDQRVMQDEDEGEWTVLQTSRPRMQQVRESDALGHSRSKSNSPTPHSRNFGKPELFPIWVGSLSPSVTYPTLHELFSRVGVVYSIKMLLEQQCAFVNYVRKEDCDRAIQCFNGMVVEGAPLSVRYPIKIHSGLGVSRSAGTDLRHSSYKKECFFWRTTGCTRQDCTYRHVPEHKNIDKDKFTSRLGQMNM
ncbi:uncharacterized protein LOC113131607 [Mastacembelus armatus]|uniref:Si:dkey-33c12.4 n=1 Tax=Mastacembelus armatus TaxID=205130 RepID=A0A3Q3KT21_9TELE|nr:uncharacterized protein LOC113131607 [Mastacembelus armatus]